MNSKEFYNQIYNLSESYENRDLEEYLLALFGKVLENKDEILTHNLVLKLLTDSFTSEPVEFQNEWLECNSPPDENIISRKFTNPEVSYLIDKTNTLQLEPFDFTLEVLKFQIAELHKMKGKQLDNEYKYLGIESETGHSWYNFDPLGNLECGTAGLDDNDVNSESLDWSFIGKLLEMGRIYE